ncbi:MAG: hypothetical protein B6D36_09935 [Planctomycetes bacterium UTPLA1]|nr:MAG: hypothetical protein B6D36_09935 [Planctomycetes bacterium UTPLA1]
MGQQANILMAKKVRTVMRGQAFAPTAGEWNAIAEATNAYHARQRGEGSGEVLPPGMVPVRNDSGQHLQRYAALGISDALVQPHHAFEQFADRIALKVLAPEDEHVGGRFVILAEPLAPNAVGRAVLNGQTPVLVQMIDETHIFADVEAGTTGNLVSAKSGSAMLLTVQPVDKRDDSRHGLVHRPSWGIIRAAAGPRRLYEHHHRPDEFQYNMRVQANDRPAGGLRDGRRADRLGGNACPGPPGLEGPAHAHRTHRG